MPDFSRQLYYRDNFRRLIWINVFLLLCVSILILYAIYNHYNTNPSTFYATTTGGELIRLNPAEHPQAASTARRVLPEEI